MKIKVGINGMGRIGRMIIRAIIESQNKNIKRQIKFISMIYGILNTTIISNNTYLEFYKIFKTCFSKNTTLRILNCI